MMYSVTQKTILYVMKDFYNETLHEVKFWAGTLKIREKIKKKVNKVINFFSKSSKALACTTDNYERCAVAYAPLTKQ